MRKYIALLLILSILLFSLTGCYDARSLESLSYVVAIGLDKGNNNLLRLSLQFASPSSDSGSNSKSSSQFSSTTVTTIECNSIDSGINLINSYISNQVNLSHAKVIVISEALATEGIADYISTFINNVEVRPDCNIIVSRSSAEDFLNNSKPTLETLSARYYEQVLSSTTYTGYTENVSLSDFYAALKSPVTQPVAILGGLNSSSTHDTSSTTPYIEADSSHEAGTTPIQDKTSLENTGLAVFDADKLVGELNAIESICHLICSNKFEDSVISIPSPFDQNGIIDISVSKKFSTKRDVKLVNGTPYITCNVYLNASVSSMGANIDVSSTENLNLISKYANSFLKQKITDYLYKTSKELHCDIDSFGSELYSDYLTVSDFEKVDWLNIYKDSYFDVNVNVSIRGSYLVIKD